VSLYFTPTVVTQLAANLSAIVAATIAVFVVGGLGAVILSQASGVDGKSGFFASIPGGAMAMAVLAERYGAQIARVDMPGAGDELHHFGWNACSSCLCPSSPHPHMKRRYLVVPGLRSSRIYILDTEPNPRHPRLAKVIEADEVIRKTGYSRPHTSHCGPDGIYVNALGDAEGNGPGGIFVLDPETFEIKGRWERDRGPQYLAYDFWWHLGHDTMITSEWGTPNMVESGVNPELLMGGKYGHALHVWDLNSRRHLQRLLGRPAMRQHCNQHCKAFLRAISCCGRSLTATLISPR
jgi:hypothetical protein